LDIAVPEISVTKLFNALRPAKFDIQTINCNIGYLRNLSSIIKSTPRDVLHAYFQLNVIKTWVTRLPKDYSRPLQVFEEATGDYPFVAPASRRDVCFGEVRDGLESLLSAVFIERAFSPEAKALGDRIVEDIKEAYATRLDSLEWMSDSTKTTAKKKCTQNSSLRCKSLRELTRLQCSVYFRSLVIQAILQT
jgi:endothelin-converting enzyme